MTHFHLPTIRGTIEQQLKQIVNYLNDQAEKLNYNVDNSTAESIFREAAKAVSSDVDNTDSQYYDNRYAALKSLIIATATEVKKTQDEKTLTLNGEYLAKSEFGTYFEKATVTIEGNPYGITQLYNYATDIKTVAEETKTVADETKTGFEEYKTNTRNFINMGYLDTSGSSPIFGIEVGLLSDTFTVKDADGNENTIRNTTPHKIRITPNEISFISNGTVRASISENEVYFPIAKITGGTIDISSGMFSVTYEGFLTSKSGNIGGWTIKSSIIEKDNTSVTDADGNPGYRVGMQSYNASPSEAAFFAGCSTASGGSIANRSSSKFYVTHGGFLYAQDAEITGKITATSLKLKGCKLSYNSLKDTPDLTVYITNTGEIKRGTVKKGTNGITISSDGLLQASNAVIYGKILATEGEIGGWEIRQKRIASANNDGTYSIVQSTGDTFLATGLPSSGSTDTSNTKFIVYHSGKLIATEAEITGKITATSGSFTGSITANGGTIGGFNIASFYIVTKDITWGTDGSLLLCSTGSSGSKSIGGSERINGWVITAGSKFGVTKDGIMYADGATISGNITASSGTIGGWEIRAKRIASANNDGTYSMVQSTGETFLATGLPSSGSTDTSNTKFIVYHSGKLIATEAEITGKITATSGSFTGSITATSGTIGNFTINGTYKYMITTGYSTFGDNGCLYFNPTGSILSKKIGGSDKRDGWVITAGSKFGVDKNGYLFCTGANMTELIVNGATINNAVFGGKTLFGKSVDLLDHLYLSKNSGIACTVYDSNNNRTSYEYLLTTGTKVLSLGVADWTMYLYGKSVYLNSSTPVTSDIRLKTGISNIGKEQEIFFMNLIPRLFKYTEGTSGRTHFGFIAQEMLDAINNSGLTTQDVAAYVSIESDRDGFEGYECGIRYGEIVALNTYMIQKCLSMINALENEILILKNERNV